MRSKKYPLYFLNSKTSMLGYTGMTGKATGIHLHLGIKPLTSVTNLNNVTYDTLRNISYVDTEKVSYSEAVTRKNVFTYDTVTDKTRQSGEVKFDMISGDENKTLKASIKFKEPLKKTPRILTSINSSGFNSDSGFCDVTKYGCTITFKRSDVIDTSVNWLAVGE